MSNHEERRCYATVRGTRLSLNDDLEPFEDGESLVIIAESEYIDMKALNDAIKAVGATGDALITTQTKYYAMERFLDEHGVTVDVLGRVVPKND